MSPGSNASPVIEADAVSKLFTRGAETIAAVDNVTFRVSRGEFVAVVGPSGAGKTTLLQLIGAMDAPTSGRLCVAGSDLSHASDGDLTRLRRDHIGFVFQHFGLLPTLTVAENVALPLMLNRPREGRRVDALLERVGLTPRRAHRPAELSGGEMQRVAIARALIRQPDLLLADEPTGNLDSATSEAILSLLRELNRDGLTIVVVTHNETLAAAADRRLALRDGRIVSDGQSKP